MINSFNMKCAFHQETEILQLQEQLRLGQYQPEPYRYFTVHEPKTRDIAAAHIKDRIVHHAICHVLDSSFERVMLPNSFACRKNRGQHKAIKQAQSYSQQYQYALKFDVRRYFASIDQIILLDILKPLVHDEKLLLLCKTIIQFPLELSIGGGKGLPIGNLTSQYFANLYLNELDWYITESLRQEAYVRYMDDELVFANDKSTLWWLLTKIQTFLAEHLKLTLKERATQIVPVTEGINYLGMRVYPNTIRLQHKSKSKFIRKMHQAKEIDSVAASIAHVSHANTLRLRQKVFSDPIVSG